MARQLRDPELTNVVRDALDQSGLPARELCLELTESMLMQDLALNSAVLAELRALGVRLALDDFGTGYSSLAYLRHLQVDRLKIDRSFMPELAERPAEQTIVAAIVGMARGLRDPCDRGGDRDGRPAGAGARAGLRRRTGIPARAPGRSR
jgi:EAL domain-containing protein (putative c-di-GMP-specific phosphodiesterase class I)